MKTKKILSVLLALVMMLSMCSVTAFADGESYRDNESFVGSNKLRIAGKIDLFGLDIQVDPSYNATLTFYKGYDGYSSEDEAGIRIAVNGMEHIGSVDKWIDVGNVGIDAIHERLEGTQVNLDTITYDWIYNTLNANLFYKLNGQTIAFTYGGKTSNFALARTVANDEYVTLTVTADDVDFGEDWEALMNDGDISVNYNEAAAEAVSATLAEGSYVRLGNQRRTLTSDVALSALDSTGEIDLANITSVLMGDIEETETLVANDGKAVFQLNRGTTVTVGKTTATLGSDIRITVEGLNITDNLIDKLVKVSEGKSDVELTDYTGLLDLIPNGGTVAITAEVSPEPEVDPEPEPEPAVDTTSEAFLIHGDEVTAFEKATAAVTAAIEGDTIQLNPNYAETGVITATLSINKSVTLDLNGATLTKEGVVVGATGNGKTLTVINSSDDPAEIICTKNSVGASYGALRCGTPNATLELGGAGSVGEIIVAAANSNALITNNATAAINVYGGTFTGAINEANGSITISGGTFDRNPGDYATIKTGYEAVDNNNDTWTVLPAVNYVAQIGNTKYETLEAAIAAANTGDTVTLLTDVNVGATVAISKSITLDGDNHTLTTTATKGIWIDNSDVTVTIENMEIVSSNNKMERSIQVNTDCDGVTLNLNNITSTATYYTVNICGNVDDLKLNIDNCDLTGWGVINLWGNNGTVNVSNSTLVGINDKGYNANGWNDFGVIILEGDTTGKTDEHSTAYNVTVTNCNITATSTTGNTQYVLLHNNPSSYNSLALDSCTITLGTNCAFYCDDAVQSVTKIKDTFISGTNNVPTLPEGYVYAPINDDYQLITQAVAEVNGVVYPTLEDALAAAPSGSTVKLLADIDYSKTYTVRNARDNGNGHAVDLRDLTLDLDGHTIASINGTVTFGGNGATITNGTFDLVEKATNGAYQDGSYALIIDNDVLSYDATGTVTVEDVTVDGGLNVCCATVTLDNVTAHTTTTKYYAVWAETDATLTINSGTFTDEQTKGKGVIATGTGTEGGAVVYVKGGTFTGVNKLVYNAEAGSLKISGGTFDKDPTAYVADGYEAVEVTTGTWQVGEVKASAIAAQETVTESYEATYSANKKVVDENDETLAQDTPITINLKADDNEVSTGNVLNDQYDVSTIVAAIVEAEGAKASTLNVSISVVKDNPEVVEENNKKTVTYEVHPVATITNEDGDTLGTYTISNDQLAVGATFVIKLPVPEELQTNGYVKVTHKLSDGSTVVYDALAYDNEGFITIADVAEFSEFELEIAETVTESASYGFTLALKNKIEIPLYVYNLADAAYNYFVEYSYTDADGLEVHNTVCLDNYSIGNGWYRFVVAEFSARQMSDQVYVRLYNNSTGEDIYNDYYSIKQYCEYMIGGGTQTESLIKLCKAALDYGKAAQLYFAYNTSSPIADSYNFLNSDVTIGPEHASSLSSNLFNFVGATVSLKSQVQVNFYFKAADYAGYTFEVNGEEVGSVQGQYYVISISGITAKDLDKPITVTVTYGYEQETFSYSPLAYAYYIQQNSQNNELIDVCKAMYLYWSAANDYLN